ncbi:MAG: sulfatase [Opitutales bacterium]|nr:sulfatase [Opitutales bacterium]
MKYLKFLNYFFLSIFLMTGAVLPLHAEGSELERPNVVFFLVDDLGYGDLGYTGSTLAETPHIDSFAAENLVFTDAYSASPHCSPTRASIVTGQYPGRLHITVWIGGNKPTEFEGLKLPKEKQYLSSEVFSVAKYFKSLGYTTAQVGKWHLGGRRVPIQEHGFDRVIGWSPGAGTGPAPTWFGPYSTIADLDGPEDEYITDRLTDEAINFMKEQQQEPFFLLLQHYVVHDPLTAPDEIVQRYVAKGLPVDKGEENATFLAKKKTMDNSFGRILEALDELDLADNTIVVFFSDNGGVAYFANNGPLRKGKKYLYEGGIRVPLIMRVPNLTPKGGTTAVPVNSIDFFPTFVELTGGDVSAQPTVFDGISIKPVLAGADQLDREAIYWHMPQAGRDWTVIPPQGAVRKGPWKLIHHYGGTKPDELYNLEDDIGETRNLARRYPERVAEMRAMLERHIDETGAGRVTEK